MDSSSEWEAKCHTRPQRSPRISKPLHLIQASYDCVVIGSGYGGGIAASRMARAGQTVCLLERGREKWPGEYPRTLKESLKELRVSGNLSRAFSKEKKIKCGNASGMYHVVVGQGQSAVVGNGLGGTSLMNANVFLEADAGTLSMDVWPPEIRDNPECLKEYYQKVRDVLEPEPYPERWPQPKKMDLLKHQAKKLGLEKYYYKVPQTTRFRPGPNSCGVSMSPSTLTGQDATGLNDGSKTTTLVTYLADAWNWGADIFCQCEVRYIEKATEERGGYNIYFVWHDEGRDKFQRDGRNSLLHVHAREAVFLGAGSLGTTEILLRSKAMGLSVSDDIGQGLSGNGDMFAFGYNTDVDVNAVAGESRSDRDPVGPTINATIDMRQAADHPLHGFVIQEGAVPQALSRVVQPIIDLHGNGCGSKAGVVRRFKKTCAAWKSRVLGPFAKAGAIQKTQVFLVMSHDSSQGTMWLENDEPMLQFLSGGGGDREHAVHSLLSTAIREVGGTLVGNPSVKLLGNHEVTVHPLGGTCMSRDNTAANGVTNHLGQVFTGRTASETHPGLIVVDGASIPAALGVNPFATIAALAERAVSEYARSKGLAISQECNGILDLYSLPAHVSARAGGHTTVGERGMPEIGEKSGYPDFDDGRSMDERTCFEEHETVLFSECMQGFVHQAAIRTRQDKASFERAYGAGLDTGQTAHFLLNAQAHREVAALTVDKRAVLYQGLLTGTFVCPSIEGSPFMVPSGRLTMFQKNPSVSGTSNLVYDFDMTGIDGRALHFHGYKTIDSSVSCDPRQLWRSLTSLYITVTDPKSSEPSVITQGKLRMKMCDFGKELRSLAATGDSAIARRVNLLKFASFFGRKSLSHLALPLLPLEYVRPTRNLEFSNTTPPSATIDIVACDGIKTQLQMWEPERRTTTASDSSARVKNLFMIPGASVDHQIFSLPTIPVNAVNYFTRAGFRVFVTVHRIGIVPASEEGNWTTYDARLDIKACIEYIRNTWSTEKLYTIAHCMGSVAFASGLLDGTIPSDWILGVTCSQVFMHPIWSGSNSIKRSAPIPLDRMHRFLSGEWFDCRATRGHSSFEAILDQLMRFYPERKEERCRSASCHRTTFLFGRCWSHDNLNEATHRHIDKFFNGANMTLMNLLMSMSGDVTNNAPDCEALTTAENIERLRGIPFFLFSGAENDVLSPAATEKTYAALTQRFGFSAGRPGGGLQYRRKVVRGYGHLDCWMGRNASEDVFPVVLEEVCRVTNEAE